MIIETDGEFDATVRASAAAVVLCASAIETSCLLLNSSTADGVGLAATSDVLGRNLMDHVDVEAFGTLPVAPAAPDVADQLGVYISSFRNLGGRDAEFARGYSIFGALGRANACYEPNVSTIALTACGEMRAHPDNRVTLHQTLRDRWGVPAARIECTHGRNEALMVEDMTQVLKEMIEAAAGKVIHISAATPPGLLIHEAGTARMGTSLAGWSSRSVSTRTGSTRSTMLASSSRPGGPTTTPSARTLLLAASLRSSTRIKSGRNRCDKERGHRKNPDPR